MEVGDLVILKNPRVGDPDYKKIQHPLANVPRTVRQIRISENVLKTVYTVISVEPLDSIKISLCTSISPIRVSQYDYRLITDEEKRTLSLTELGIL